MCSPASERISCRRASAIERMLTYARPMCQYLYVCTGKAYADAMLTKVSPMCQYLYFCPSKASKVSTCWHILVSGFTSTKEEYQGRVF